VLSEMYDEARRIEKELELELGKRARFDAHAATALQIQNRRSSSVNSVEIAEVRTRRAVDFFGDIDESGALRNPIELYRALNNHAALLIELGRYPEAVVVARRGEEVVVAFQAQGFPRHDVLAHNLVLATLRSGAISPKEAVIRQEIIVASDVGKSDNFLQRCNLAAFRILDEQFDAARVLLDALKSEIATQGLTESYLTYYCDALRLGLAFATNDLPSARVVHEGMSSFVAKVRWPTAAYVRRRHELVGQLLHEGAPAIVAPRDVDQLLVARFSHEIGPCWNHHGRVLTCNELAFWSDS
jgi:hypothetical protein